MNKFESLEETLEKNLAIRSEFEINFLESNENFKNFKEYRWYLFQMYFYNKILGEKSEKNPKLLTIESKFKGKKIIHDMYQFLFNNNDKKDNLFTDDEFNVIIENILNNSSLSNARRNSLFTYDEFNAIIESAIIKNRESKI